MPVPFHRTPALDGFPHVAPMLPSSTEALASEMKIDFHKNGRPFIGKHEIETSHVDGCLPAKLQDSEPASLLHRLMGTVIETPSPADIVVERSIAHAEIRKSSVPVDHHSQVATTVLYPALHQRRLIPFELCAAPLKILVIMNGKDGDPPSPRVSLYDKGIFP